MNKPLVIRIAAIVSALLFAVMVGVNALANILPLNNVNTGQLSDEIPNLFVPVGLTFSVWGLIYLLLLGYAIVVIKGAFRKEPRTGWNGWDGLWYSLNALLNSAWIFAWHWRQVGLSLLLMFGILGTLLVLMERNYRSFCGLGEADSNKERLRRGLLRVPLLVYLGWICVATIANITAWLVSVGWAGFGLHPVFWTVLVLIAGTAVGLLLVFRRGAASSGLVVVWAYLGIILKRLEDTSVDGTPIIIVAGVGGVLILAAIGWRLWRQHRPRAC